MADGGVVDGRKEGAAVGAEVRAEEVDGDADGLEEKEKGATASVGGSGCELSSMVSPSDASIAAQEDDEGWSASSLDRSICAVTESDEGNEMSS